MRSPRGLAAPFLVAALLGLLAPCTARAQEHTPEEYQEDEFPAWLHSLRRGETVFLGSLPFTLFAVTLGYDTVRYAIHLNDADADPRRYAPWPFRSSNPVPYTTAENVGVVIGVVGVSLAISVADFLIGQIRERRSAAR